MDTSGTGESKNINRREFVKLGLTSAALAGAGVACSKGGDGNIAGAKLPRRRLGNTDMEISIVAMGGGSALGMVRNQEEAVALIDLARSCGINFFDSSASYGRSESFFGEALQPYRKSVYLSTKYEPEDNPDELRRKIEKSLKGFRTDYIDVAHIHGLVRMEDVETMFSSGALETLVKLKEEGVVRYIGITSHNHPPAMKSALERFRFDVCFQAANASKTPFIFEFEELPRLSFEEHSLPVALDQGIGVLAFKITGQRRLIRKGNEQDKAPAAELIRYGLSLPVHGVLLGMSTPEHVTSAVKMASTFQPMTREEMGEWNRRLAPSANELTLHYLRPEYVDDGGWREHLV
jgi:predicted aldo/keto reductase-like oxidoreductase